ncbi:hypothetical protein K5X82_02790 [Halosquirtibacter xylanolyticus]|uniref:hypothetical protein n=1 Tax=Halosquirtibacter xylanolyticus TaxID=3374599 RepID=UPI003748FC71|nr:hypothetical protein K5X82_02790 [Prolixibacteraceae bacterium]
MIKQNVLFILMIFFSFTLMAQNQRAEADNKSTSPAFLQHGLKTVEGVPSQYGDFFVDLTKAIERHDEKMMIKMMCQNSTIIEDKKQWEPYLDHFWVGKEEHREYDGLVTVNTKDIKHFDVVSHQVMKGAMFVNCRLTTKKKKYVIVQLLVKETAYGPIISDIQ